MFFFCLPHISSANAQLALAEEFSTCDRTRPGLGEKPVATPVVKGEMNEAKEKGRDRIFVGHGNLRGSAHGDGDWIAKLRGPLQS
jgi:hypothetical protein